MSGEAGAVFVPDRPWCSCLRSARPQDGTEEASGMSIWLIIVIIVVVVLVFGGGWRFTRRR